MRTPQVGRLMAAAAVARLPLGIDGLAILLFVRQETGSFATAGLAAAAFGGGIALSMPVVGRLIDRHGQARVLVPLALLHASMLGLLIWSGAAEARDSALVATALAAGWTLPPIGAAVRPLLPGLLAATPQLVPAAYALDAVLIELSFVAGPLLTAAAVAVFAPAAALAAACALVVIGTTALVTAPASRGFRPSDVRRGRLPGALRSAGVRTLALCALPLGFCLGATEVALPAFAEDVSSAAVAGLLLALWSAGSLLGGLTYGARSRVDRVSGTYVQLALVLPVTWLPLAGAWSLPAMSVLVVIAGLAIAPLLSAANQLVGEVAPAGAVTEAYGWPVTALTLGVAGGSAAAGAVIEAEGWRAALLVASTGAAATAALALGRRRTLVPE